MLVNGQWTRSYCSWLASELADSFPDTIVHTPPAGDKYITEVLVVQLVAGQLAWLQLAGPWMV